MNVKVIDYSLIEADSSEELVEATAAACRKENWFPCGGVCVWFQPGGDGPHAFPDAVHYVQALVKYGPI